MDPVWPGYDAWRRRLIQEREARVGGGSDVTQSPLYLLIVYSVIV